MKKKQIILLSIVIAVVVACCVGGYFLFHAWNEDVKAREEEILNLKEEYKTFSEEALTFNERKKEFDQKISEIYYNTLKKENEGILNSLNGYKESKNILKELGNSMEEKCGRYSKRNDLTTICSSFRTSLETAENIYKEDIVRYQKLIKEYNEWTESHTDFEKIEEYEE